MPNPPHFSWLPSSRESYTDALHVLPPAAERPSMFLLGEAIDHFSETGAPRFRVHRQVAGDFYVGSRPVTSLEFYSLT